MGRAALRDDDAARAAVAIGLGLAAAGGYCAAASGAFAGAATGLARRR